LEVGGALLPATLLFLGVFGVFASSVADAEATLRVMAGFDPADPWSREFAAGSGTGAGLADGSRVLRVGYATTTRSAGTPTSPT